MNIDKYCEDGLLFDVMYTMKSGDKAISKFMFPIDYTQEQVKEKLSNAPHHLTIVDVHEIGYVLRPNEAFYLN